MSRGTVEERLAELEKQLAEVKAQVAALARSNDWRSAIGMFEGDEGMKRIFDQARKIREEDRRRTKPKPPKSKKRTRS